MRRYSFGPTSYDLSRPIFALSADPLSNGALNPDIGPEPGTLAAPAEVPWWQPLASGFGNLALQVGRTFVPAVIQSELTGRPPTFGTTPTGQVIQTAAPAPTSDATKWIVPLAIGAVVFLMLMKKK